MHVKANIRTAKVTEDTAKFLTHFHSVTAAKSKTGSKTESKTGSKTGMVGVSGLICNNEQSLQAVRKVSYNDMVCRSAELLNAHGIHARLGAEQVGGLIEHVTDALQWVLVSDTPALERLQQAARAGKLKSPEHLQLLLVSYPQLMQLVRVKSHALTMVFGTKKLEQIQTQFESGMRMCQFVMCNV